MNGPETLHPPLAAIAVPPIPHRAPDSDKVGPMLIVGGGNVHRLAGLDALAQEIAERAGVRRIELRRCAFHHDAAQGHGVSAWAFSANGAADWLGTAAGRGVTVETLSALLAPQAQRVAA